MNVLATIQKLVVCVVSSLYVSIIICYESKLIGCLHCMKALAIIQIEMLVSVV